MVMHGGGEFRLVGGPGIVGVGTAGIRNLRKASQQRPGDLEQGIKEKKDERNENNPAVGAHVRQKPPHQPGIVCFP